MSGRDAELLFKSIAVAVRTLRLLRSAQQDFDDLFTTWAEVFVEWHNKPMVNFSLTPDQVREIDRAATERYAIPSLLLMENAGRGCVDVLERLGIAGPVVIACGKGNNGGDGLVMARHLFVRGYEVRLLLVGTRTSPPPDAAANLAMVDRLPIPQLALDSDSDSDLSHCESMLADAQ